MAHNVDVPIVFEFHPYPASWRVATATIAGWTPRAKKRSVQATVEQGGTRFLVDLDLWPLLKTLKPLQESSDTIELVGYPVELLVCRVKLRAVRRQADPWTMREEFLRLKQDTKALLAFLNQWGVWGRTQTSVSFIPSGSDSLVPGRVPLLQIGLGGSGRRR
jgi:hypothetical protein